MKESQDQKVLNWLKAGKALTTYRAIVLWKHTRLSRSINTLRKDHTIYGKILYTSDNTHFKIYYMENSPLFKIHGKSF